MRDEDDEDEFNHVQKILQGVLNAVDNSSFRFPNLFLSEQQRMGRGLKVIDLGLIHLVVAGVVVVVVNLGIFLFICVSFLSRVTRPIIYRVGWSVCRSVCLSVGRSCHTLLFLSF